MATLETVYKIAGEECTRKEEYTVEDVKVQIFISKESTIAFLALNGEIYNSFVVEGATIEVYGE